MVTDPVDVKVVLQEAKNGFVLNALPYIENERYFHEGEGRFFAKNGSSISFEINDKEFVKTLEMDNDIRGEKKE